RFDIAELLEGVDTPQPQMVRLQVEHHGDVIALIAQALTQDAATRDLEDCEIDAWILQNHPRRPRPRRVRPDEQSLIDNPTIGRGHAHLLANAFEDVGDHARCRGLAICAGDSDDRYPARSAGREQHVDHWLRHVLGITDRRMGVHPETGCCVHLADRSAGLAYGLRDIRRDEVDACNVEPDHARGLLGNLDVLRVCFEGAVNGDATGGHFAGQGQLYHFALRWNVVHVEPLSRNKVNGSLIDLDPGQHLLMANATAGVGIWFCPQV